MILDDSRTCPACNAELEQGEFVLADLDYDRWHGKANMPCPGCGAPLVVQEVEVRIGLYGGGNYYNIELSS